MLDLSWGWWEGLDTSRSENKTRLVLVAGRQPWRWAVGLAASLALGGRPPPVAWDAGLSPIVRAGLNMAGGDHLLPVPDLDGEGVQSAAQQWVGAFIGPLQERDNSTTTHPDAGGTHEVRWELVGQLLAKLCLLGRENAGVSLIFENLLTVWSTENSSTCKNSFGKTRDTPWTASDRWKTCVLSGLWSEAKENPESHRSKLLQRLVHAMCLWGDDVHFFYWTVRCCVVSCGLVVLDAKHFAQRSLQTWNM